MARLLALALLLLSADAVLVTAQVPAARALATAPTEFAEPFSSVSQMVELRDGRVDHDRASRAHARRVPRHASRHVGAKRGSRASHQTCRHCPAGCPQAAELSAAITRGPSLAQAKPPATTPQKN